MKTVAIELERLKYLHCGLGQYCLNLANTLLSCKDLDFSLQLMVSSRMDYSLLDQSAECKVLRKMHKKLNFLAPSADLWHIVHQDSNYLPPSSRIPLLLTVHDLNFLYTKKSLVKQQRRLSKLQRLLDRAAHITVISNATKADLLQHCDVNVPISVIYNGVNIQKPCTAKPNFILDSEFLFTIADITEKKRFHTLIHLLLELPNLHLVVAGNKNNAYANYIIEYAKEHRVSERLILPGIVTESEKAWLYQNCKAFCFPSMAEGFGLPVVEALAYNKPVLLSDIPAHREVAQRWAHYFQSFKSKAMRDVYEQCLSEHSQRDSADHAALKKHLDQFTWDKSARAYCELYQCLLA